MPDDARYRRIADDIRRRIANDEWRPGESLPSRRVMAAQYGVHHETINLAYAALRRAGILEGEERKRVVVAHPPAVRTLIFVDAAWPHSSETADTRPRPATEELADRLDVAARTVLQHETVECLDPGGRSAMLVTSWWRSRRQPHAAYTAELDTVPLAEDQAHALGLLVDTVAFRVVRTRLDMHGTPVETADLILPMDRWRIRLGG